MTTINPGRRRLLAGTAAALALGTAPRARAQAFPSRNMRVVIPTGQGGGADRLARVFDDFWGPFSQALAEANEKMEAVKGIETGEACPLCQKPLVTRFSPKTGNDFVGCSGWPECKYIKKTQVKTGVICPDCGKGELVRRRGRGRPAAPDV